MLRKLIPAGAILALLSGPALPQSLNLIPDTKRHLTAEEQQQERDAESRYRETINGIPDKKTSKDPWGNVRSAPAAKQPASAAKQPQR